MEHRFDVLVVGAGHAGTEAALAAARIGAHTGLLTINLDTLGQMSCNPAIGGLAKGQMVREIDALGGEMGRVIDQTGIQFRMLGTARGPAVHSPRAQADKRAYAACLKRVVELCPGLELRQEIVEDLLIEGDRVRGVTGRSGIRYLADAVVLTTGTFLGGLIHLGRSRTPGGRSGERPAERLAGSLRDLGFQMGRLKTGTPPRVNRCTVDLSGLEVQPGDDPPQPFSFSTGRIEQPQLDCWITATNPRTHQIIETNLHESPVHRGQIEGTGVRYCPSIEDKVERFPGRDHHRIYIEPEGRDTLELYLNGISTSLPPAAQEEFVHSIEGLERAQIMRYGYAVEYDYVQPTELDSTLECRRIEGLFHAGQINGTTGYEEAAAQGLMAGINAARKVAGAEGIVLDRSEAYIGVLIDDLVTLGTAEPYRMFTSRAEYRLLLRHDNADRRLTARGHAIGLIDQGRHDAVRLKQERIDSGRAALATRFVEGASLEKMLRRPEVSLADLIEHLPEIGALPSDVRQQIEFETKYAGYIARQEASIERFRRMESVRLPDQIDYEEIPHLSTEAREKFGAVRPRTLGQASRISGVRQSDLDVLATLLRAGVGV